MSEIDDFFNIESPKKQEEIKSPGRPKKEVKEDIKVYISGEEFSIGHRVRMKENINRIKESQLVEIIGMNKAGEIHIQSVYDHSKLYVSPEQLSID